MDWNSVGDWRCTLHWERADRWEKATRQPRLGLSRDISRTLSCVTGELVQPVATTRTRPASFTSRKIRAYDWRRLDFARYQDRASLNHLASCRISRRIGRSGPVVRVRAASTFLQMACPPYQANHPLTYHRAPQLAPFC